MSKNVPLLSFDQDQEIWNLDFSDHGNPLDAEKSTKVSEPDKLTHFLLDYWSSTKSFSALESDQYKEPLKLPVRQKKLAIKKSNSEQDQLFSFLKEHKDLSAVQEKRAHKNSLNLFVRLNE